MSKKIISFIFCFATAISFSANAMEPGGGMELSGGKIWYPEGKGGFREAIRVPEEKRDMVEFISGFFSAPHVRQLLFGPEAKWHSFSNKRLPRDVENGRWRNCEELKALIPARHKDTFVSVQGSFDDVNRARVQHIIGGIVPFLENYKAFLFVGNSSYIIIFPSNLCGDEPFVVYIPKTLFYCWQHRHFPYPFQNLSRALYYDLSEMVRKLLGLRYYRGREFRNTEVDRGWDKAGEGLVGETTVLLAEHIDPEEEGVCKVKSDRGKRIWAISLLGALNHGDPVPEELEGDDALLFVTGAKRVRDVVLGVRRTGNWDAVSTSKDGNSFWVKELVGQGGDAREELVWLASDVEMPALGDSPFHNRERNRIDAPWDGVDKHLLENVNGKTGVERIVALVIENADLARALTKLLLDFSVDRGEEGMDPALISPERLAGDLRNFVMRDYLNLYLQEDYL